MSTEATRKILIGRLKTAWDASSYSAVPLSYENQSVPLGDTYVYVRINSGFGSQLEINSNPYQRFDGYIQMDVMVKQGSGTALARSMADELAGVFRRIQIADPTVGYIQFRTETIREIGEEHGYFRIMVRVPFERDTQFS